MAPKVHHKQISAENQETIRELLQEKLKLAVRYTLIEAIEEVQAYIRATRYERNEHRKDHRNGTYVRNLGTAMGELEELPVPRTRKFVHNVRRRGKALLHSLLAILVTP